MNKLKYSVPNRILRTLYFSLVSPYINYAILIWGNTSKCHLDKLIKLQKWAIRTVSNSHYRSHTAPLFVENNTLTVTDMYVLELGVFMYKFNINDLPVSFKDYFKKRSDTHCYQTRQIDDLSHTFNKKSFSDHCVRASGPTLWNSLPKSIKESRTTKQFRNHLKQKMINNYE